MMWLKRTLVLTLSVLIWGTLAQADDFMPPDFRGDPLTVVAEWDMVRDFTADPYFYYNYDPDYDNYIGRAQGIYDEFRVYNYRLSSAEVMASYKAGPDALPEEKASE